MAVELNDVKDPGRDLVSNNPEKITENIAMAANYGEFPYPDAINRLNYYDYYTKLFMGDHFNAFSIAIDNEQWGRAYARLRYVMVNFAGLVSKVIADFLFSEPITIKCPDGDQEFIDALVRQNHLDTQLYESALTNSYLGDDLFKLRAGPRNFGENSTVIIENTTPKIYFPKVNPFNVREQPNDVELAWTFTQNNIKYLRKEIHSPGQIRNEVWELKGNKIVAQVDISILGIPNLQPLVPTGINRPLIYHVANWKTGNRHFGISDYFDLDSLFFAINNRMTKTDNILDKHSDPILMVPPGVLDEKGQVKKKALGVIEVGEGETGKPEYIVWDASLDNAFKQIEGLVNNLLMTAEISKDVFGMGTGQSDSGRALKYKLLRTIAKASRKKLYYDAAIKDMLYTAQIWAKQLGLTVDGKKLQGDPSPIEIDWKDGIPTDETEQIENEVKAVDAGLTSKKASIMRIYGVDEATAEKMLKDIEKEKPKIELPSMKVGANGNGDNMDNMDGMNGNDKTKNGMNKNMSMS